MYVVVLIYMIGTNGPIGLPISYCIFNKKINIQTFKKNKQINVSKSVSQGPLLGP